MNTRVNIFVLTAAVVLAASWATCGADTSPADALASGFATPPDSARPWVYWFWLNGNITREGITADLEAMKRVGIGGVLIMEVDQGAPVGPVDFMSPDWRELFQHVHAEAERLGLEVNMNNDAGWNGSGGPWITPEQSMQKVVWTETDVTGPKRFEEPLPQPETVAGFYRDISSLAFPATGRYRIDRHRAKAMLRGRRSGRHPSRRTVPAEMTIARDKISHADRTHGRRRAARLGRAAGRVDDRSIRPHQHRRRKRPGTRRAAVVWSATSSARRASRRISTA